MKRKGGISFEANESLLENPTDFSVPLVFDGLLVGIFCRMHFCHLPPALNNALKTIIIYDHCICTKNKAFLDSCPFIVLIVMDLIVGWLIWPWEGMASGSGIRTGSRELVLFKSELAPCSLFKIIGGTLYS